MVIRRRPMRFMRKFILARGGKWLLTVVCRGVDPLTPEDIAEVVVFVAGRKENVVVADTLIFPSHQAGAGVMHRKST
jgi:3-hydroxy acid dehydrogenase/malonic semialdehyde reductase